LYYGALKGSPHKWLNAVELARQLVAPGDTIGQVKYFTARVSGAADPGAPGRQQQYLSALQTLPEVEVHFGRFLAKTVWRPLVNLPLAGAAINLGAGVIFPAGSYPVAGGSLKAPASIPVGVYPPKGRRKFQKPKSPAADALIVECHTMEEKGSDVNLAAHLLNDAWRGAFEAAVVISNDTDLCEPIRMVTAERHLPVHLVCPDRNRSPSPGLAAVSTSAQGIKPAMLVAAQFPNPIPPLGLAKPAGW
jgi:hypothetical protein